MKKKITLTILNIVQIVSIFLPWFIIVRTKKVVFFTLSSNSGIIFGNYLPGGWLGLLVSVIGIVLIFRKNSLINLVYGINFIIGLVYLLGIIDPNWLASKPFYGEMIKLFGLYIFTFISALAIIINILMSRNIKSTKTL